MVELTCRWVKDTKILVLSGSLIGAEAAKIKKQIKYITKNDPPYLIFDLNALYFIDARGLSVFVSTLKLVHAQKGDILLLNPTPSVCVLLELTRLQHVFNIYRDEEAAVFECKKMVERMIS